MNNHSRWIDIETLIQEIEFLKARIRQLEHQIYFAIDDRDNRIIELESLANPYSNCGEAICNYPVD